jgi:hypothetical protein
MARVKFHRVAFASAMICVIDASLHSTAPLIRRQFDHSEVIVGKKVAVPHELEESMQLFLYTLVLLAL